MILFILCCLSLAILVQTSNEVLVQLASPVALGIGITSAIASMILGYFKKISTMAWHDGFATSSLLVWFAYWKPQFDDGAPMFLAFPLYYALLTSILTLALINKAQYFDQESVEYLRGMERLTRFDMRTIVALVIASLLITRHYALYPMAMTFFVVRHTMLLCLEIIDQEA